MCVTEALFKGRDPFKSNKLLKALIFKILCLTNQLTFVKLLQKSSFRDCDIQATCALLILTHYVIMLNTGHTARWERMLAESVSYIDTDWRADTWSGVKY